ncbi:MAG: CsbD family protein [Actinobacteria bacterium]|nr:CsbD family protein [Actinomycetota bacterium]
MDRDRIEGNVKEAEGKLTGDEELEKEGQAQDSWGKAKDSASDAVDAVKDAGDDAKDAVDKRI